MEISRATMKKLMVLIAFAALAFSFFQWIDNAVIAIRFLGSILSPFLIGAAIAFVLNVPMRFLEAKLFPTNCKRKYSLPNGLIRSISLILTLLLVVAVLLLLVLVVVPQLAATIAGLGETIQNAAIRLLNWLELQFANNPQAIAYLESISIDWSAFDWEGILSKVAAFLKNGAGDMITSTIGVAKSFVSGIATFFISFVFSMYLLLQKEKLQLHFHKVLYALLPQNIAEKTISVCTLSHRIFSSFITGQCTEAVILGSMFFITMTLLKMPYALLVGCLISVTALLPIVGAFIGCGVGVFLLLMVSPMQALVFVIMFLILQQVEGNLIYPHVVGNSVGLPSIWVLAAVTIGGNLMGVVGMLVFIPLASVIYTLFREFVNRRLKTKGIKVK